LCSNRGIVKISGSRSRRDGAVQGRNRFLDGVDIFLGLHLQLLPLRARRRIQFLQVLLDYGAPLVELGGSGVGVELDLALCLRSALLQIRRLAVDRCNVLLNRGTRFDASGVGLDPRFSRFLLGSELGLVGFALRFGNLRGGFALGLFGCGLLLTAASRKTENESAGS
jgi:hypothetical protein